MYKVRRLRLSSKPLNGTILMAKSIASLEAKYFRAREQELLKELNLKATTCPLTGIYNRQVVFDKIEECFEKLEAKIKVMNFLYFLWI